MFRKLIATPSDCAIAVVRIVLGAVMLPHGLQKLLGWYGGYGFSATVNYFKSGGTPAPLAVLVILGESLGALALILGFAGRFMAFGITAIMLGAIVKVHAHNGFFMNWSGKGLGEGYEYHLLMLGMAVAIMIRGSGSLSIDRLLQRRLDRGRASSGREA
jgi:putative oxidoreductase